MTRTAVALLALLPNAHADGKCDAGSWSIAFDGKASDLAADPAAAWADAVLVTDGLEYRLERDGAAELVAEYPVTARAPLALGLFGCTAFADHSCGDPVAAYDLVVTEAARPELVGAGLDVGNAVVLTYSIDGAPATAVWNVGGWIGD